MVKHQFWPTFIHYNSSPSYIKQGCRISHRLGSPLFLGHHCFVSSDNNVESSQDVGLKFSPAPMVDMPCYGFVLHMPMKVSNTVFDLVVKYPLCQLVCPSLQHCWRSSVLHWCIGSSRLRGNGTTISVLSSSGPFHAIRLAGRIWSASEATRAII